MASEAAVAVPETTTSATPYICVKDAVAAIEFYKKAFGAVEVLRLKGPGPKIGHAQIHIGGAVIMLSDEFPDFGALSPQSIGGSPVQIQLYVPDVDAFVARAVEAGAKIRRPVADQFYGDRSGNLADPFGYTWIISTRKEVVSAEEMQRRMDAMAEEWKQEHAAAGKRQPTSEERRQYTPEGFHTVTPYLVVSEAARLIDFMKRAFDATEKLRVLVPGESTLMHAEVSVGDSMIELADASEHFPAAPATIHLSVADADAAYEKALQAGATSLYPPADQFWGEHECGVRDQLGNEWYISTPTWTAFDPAKFRTVQPYLHVRGANKMIEFMKQAFGATAERVAATEGIVAHAEIHIGDTTLEIDEGYRGFRPAPCYLHLYVPNVDAVYDRALAAGASAVEPPNDKPYGDRAAGVKDPFGFTWFLATHVRDVALEQMPGPEEKAQRTAPRVKPIREGFHTVQPYMVAQDGPALLEFVKRAFGAEEKLRAMGPAGGLHGEVRIGDSIVMMGGGIPRQPFKGKTNATALHVYVEDTDAVYAKALEAGAVSISAPQDHEYGERGAGVKDFAGNFWYIATHKGETYIPKGLNNVNIFLHPRRAEPLIAFLKRAFGAHELAKYASPDGVVHHAEIRVGDSVVEMGESHGAYQPMSPMMYLYVPDADAVYRRALGAGAKSLQEPTDQPYGDRNAAVTDAFGNTWYIATHVRDVQP